MTTAAVRYSIRTGLFVAASFVAVLAAEGHAHADDPSQAATPAPDPNAGGATPPPDTTPTVPPATPGGSVDVPTTPATPPDVTTPPPVLSIPGGSIDVPTSPTTPTLPAAPPPTGDESATPSADGGWPATTPGSHTSQDADVTTGGSSVANTGGNTGVAVGTGGPAIYLPGGVSSTITTGTANGQGSVDTNGISQEINATVTQNGKVVVVQVAVIVNIGIGLAGSGGNVANTESVAPPKPASSVAMIVGTEAAGAGAGTGPTPASIGTGNATSTGNSGTTNVTQSIVLTGNDVAQQLAAVLNLGVGVANSGLNFALAAVAGNSSGSPSSVTFVTTGAPSSITAGSASALGTRSTSAVFQVVTVSASGNGSLLVIQRAVIVNFGLALANSGLNVAGGGALNAALPDPAAAQQLLLMLLGSGSAAPGAALTGGGPVVIGTGNATAVGNDTTTGIHQTVTGSVTGDETAKAIQDAWVGNFGLALANTGANGAASGLAGINPASLQAAQGALQAFLAGLTGIGDPLQGLDASFNLGGNLLQLHGDVSGTESLLGVTEPGTDTGPDDAAVVVRQVTAVLNIGLAMSDSGHNVAVSTTEGTDHTLLGGTGATVASTTITTGDATAVGSHFATTVCQTIGDALACATPDPPSTPSTPDQPDPTPIPEVHEVQAPNPPAPFTPERVSVPGTVAATLPFTGSPIGAELAAGSGLLIAGMLMARRRRIGARP